MIYGSLEVLHGESAPVSEAPLRRGFPGDGGFLLRDRRRTVSMTTMKIPPFLLILSAIGSLMLVGCQTATSTGCNNADGALDEASFVFVTQPTAGQRVAPGFTVSGCSRTFESNVPWRLQARDGSELAAGHTTGGGADGFGPFSFVVNYTIDARQIGHLEVYDEDVSDGEGFPPGRNVVPLVLTP